MKMIFLLILAWASVSFADDTKITRVGMNFQPSQTQTIAMENEVLDIGEKRIRVDFVFRNLGKAAESIEIAFPFAEHRFYEGGGNTCPGEPEDDPTAELSVDGSPVPFRWEHKFKLGGVALSPEWNNLLMKTSPDPEGCGGGPGVWKATAAALAADPLLVKKPDFGNGTTYKDIAQIDELYRKQFKRTDYERIDSIRVQEFLTWKYTFPPGKEVKVTHIFSDSHGERVAGYGRWDGNYEKDACLNDDPVKKVWERVKRGNCQDSMQFLRYVLKSGANWAKPIGKFTLVVHKLEKDEVVSTCFPGLKKVSDLEYRAELTNYRPKEDLAFVWIPAECAKGRP